MVFPFICLKEDKNYTFIFKDALSPKKQQKTTVFYYHPEAGPCLYINEYFLIPFSYITLNEPDSFTIKICTIKNDVAEVVEQLIFDERWWGAMKGYLDMISIFQNSVSSEEEYGKISNQTEKG